MSTSSRKRSDRIAADQALIAGIQKFLMQYPSLYVGSQTLTPAAIVQVLQNRITTSQAAITAEAARAAAVKADRDEAASTAAFEQSLRAVILGMFSQSPDSLAIFGLKPRKRHTPTVATKSGAVARSLATRKARHTMGPKQKQEITGETAQTGSGTTPGTPAPAEPASPAAPTTPAAPTP